MTGPILEFDRLVGGYGGGTVVHGVGAAVAPGETLCVLGRNGVGKTTLLALLYGFLAPAAGTVRFDGADITGLAPVRLSRLGIGFCPQERVVFDDLTVADNLTLTRPNRRLDHVEPFFATFPWLADRLRQRAGTLSGGERKILSLVRVLAEAKPLALLDEPSEGVARENVALMAELINQRKAGGDAFVIVEQNLDLVDAVADRYLVLDQGRAVLAGDRATVSRRDIVAHLGV